MMLIYALLLLFLHNVAAQRDTDLMSFVTLPETRALKFDITYHDRSRVAPGYWFVAPYGLIVPEAPTQRYQQFQVGPYIYDGDGMLIWAGSPMFDNRNVFDFKAVDNIDDEPHLSLIAQRSWEEQVKGSGMVLNNRYEIEKQVFRLPEVDEFNIHEFNVLPGGETALACVYRQKPLDLADIGRPGEISWFLTGGFAEFNLTTGEPVFLWDSTDHLGIHESNRFMPWTQPLGPPGFDYVHMNSIDKNVDGDYLISMRFTNTIYLISGVDGHVMWRLGGEESDFLQDFFFSKQHDVKFIESQGTHHIISILNNGGDELQSDEEVSSSLIVELDAATTPMTAKVLKRYNRPDGLLTKLRGNAQLLPNGNMFSGWSEFGYQSEHSPEGDVLMEARFASTRFSTYRAYKYPFVGRPSYDPTVVASVYGTEDEDLTTIIHVSWNGATDVAGWNFYAQAYDRGTPIFIGHTNKTDFETLYIAHGFMDWVSVEAVDIDGKVMRGSGVVRSQIPSNWKSAGYVGEADSPAPDDPSIVYEATHKGASGSDDDSMADMVGDEGQSKEYSATHAGSYATAKEVANAVYKAYDVVRAIAGFLAFIIVVGIVGGAAYGIYWLVGRRRQVRSYQHVPTEEGLPMEETRLRNTPAE